jgi:hypothetical protein
VWTVFVKSGWFLQSPKKWTVFRVSKWIVFSIAP